MDLYFTAVSGVESGETKLSFATGNDDKSYVEYAPETGGTIQYGSDTTATQTVTINGVAPTLDAVKLVQEDSSEDTSHTVTAVGGKAADITVQAKAYSQQGTDITEKVTWSIEPSNSEVTDTGVTINTSTGLITVDDKAKAGTYSVTAAADGTNVLPGENVGGAQLVVNREGWKLSSVTLDPNTVTVTGTGEKTVTATAYDQYDDEIKSGLAEWTVALKGDNGTTVTATYEGVNPCTITVAGNAKSGSYDITATDQQQHTATAKLTVSRKEAALSSFWINAAIGTESVDTTSPIDVPAVGEGDKTITLSIAEAKDQYGDPYTVTSSDVTYSITGTTPAGVVLDGSTLTITTDAAQNDFSSGKLKFTVQAAIGGVTKTQEFTLTAADKGTVSTVKIFSGETEVASDTIGIPQTGATSKTYSAKAYDKYGIEVSDAAFNWSLSDVDDISINGSTVSVASTTASGAKATLTAACGGITGSITITAASITVDWSGWTVKADGITYGDARSSAFASIPATGTAAIGGTTLKGTFAVVDGTQTLDAGKSQTVIVQFTVTSEGAYQNCVLTKDFTVTVAPAEVSVDWSDLSQEYTGSALAPTAKATGVNGETLTLAVTVSKKGDGPDVSNDKGKDAGEYTATAALDASATNYTLKTDGTSTTFTITPKEVGLTWAGYANLTYTGTAKAVTATATGLADGDGCTVTVTGGGETDVGSYTATATGLSNQNYKLPSTNTQSYTIDKATLTPSVGSVNSKTYDGTTTATGTITLTDAVNSETPTASGTFTWTSADAGTNTVDVEGITLDGEWGKNYQLSTTSLSNASAKGASIAKATVPTDVTAAGKTVLSSDVTQNSTNYTYDLSTGITGMPGDAGTLSYAVSGTNSTYATNISVSGSTLSFTIVEPKAANTTDSISITVSSTNYADVTVTVTLTFKSKTDVSAALTLENVTAAYGDDYTVAGSYSGTQDTTSKWSYSYTGIDGTTYGPSAEKPTDAGTYTITATYEDDIVNEDVPGHIGTVSATLTISQREAVLVWKTTDSANGEEYAGAYTYTGAVQGVYPFVSNLVGTDTCAVTVSGNTGTNANSYTATVATTGLGNTNYKLSNDVTKNWSIEPKSVTVDWGTLTGLTYTGANQAATISGQITIPTGIDGETITPAVTFKKGGSNVTDITNAGDYTATVSIGAVTGGQAAASNYTLTGDTTKTFTVSKAAATVSGAPTSFTTILANDTHNASAEALLGYVQGECSSVSVNIPNGSTLTNVPITWALKTGRFDAKGGSYTFEGTVAGTDNYTVTKPTATLTVESVSGTLSLTTNTATKAMSQITGAADYAAMGLPTTLSVDFENASVTDEDYTITGWSMTVAQIKSAAAGAASKDVPLTLTPIFNADAWATLGTVPTFTLTITAKIPVEVMLVNKPIDITYGKTLTSPTVTIAELAAGVTPIYTYTGTTAAGASYDSTTAPKDAGSYTLTVTLNSDVYSGTDSTTFTIAPKEVGLTWTGNTGLTYDGTAKAVTATATGLETGDTCTVTVTGGAETNAGTHTATATGLSNANYILPTANTQSYTIAKAERSLTLTSPATVLLYPGSLTANITATYDNKDSSAVVVYTSDNTAAVTVNSAGKLTGVANGSATVTVSIAETGNYNAATATVAVNSITEALTGVTVTGDTGDKVTAAISGDKIVVSGIASDLAKLTVTGTAASGATAETSSDGKTVTVKVGGTTIATYSIDTTNVVVNPTKIDVNEEKPTPDTTVIPEAQREIVTEALTSDATKTEGLAESAAKELVDIAENLETSATVTSLTEPTITVTVSVEIKAESLTQDSFVLEITPVYEVTATGTGDGESTPVPVQDTTPLPSGALTTPVTVSVKLPDGFGTPNYAKHTLSNGSVEMLPVTVSEDGVATWQQSSFSKVELISDARTATVNFKNEDGSVQTVVYTPADIGKALPTLTKDGYTFNGWTIDGSTYTTLTDALLTTLNSSTVDADPVFTKNSSGNTGNTGNTGSTGGGGGGSSSSSSYVITASAGTGGSISPSGTVRVTRGSDRTFTITPSSGYDVKDVVVDSKSVGAVRSYTFDNVTKAHTITVTFTQKEETVADLFTDITASSWCFDAVQFVYDRGLMNGTSATTFEPAKTLNRGMWVTMLYRMAGSPSVTGSENFTDVDESTWCYDAIIWGCENGIITGFSDGTFRISSVVTRQQLVVMLYRYAQYQGYDTSASAALTGYTDASQVWAADAMSWAVGAGILAGTSTTTLSPNNSANRGQAATFLMRFVNAVVE